MGEQCCEYAKKNIATVIWTVACQPPLSMGFSGQEYWSGLPCPSLGDLLQPGIELVSPRLAGGFFTIRYKDINH